MVLSCPGISYTFFICIISITLIHEISVITIIQKLFLATFGLKILSDCHLRAEKSIFSKY